MTRSKPKGQKAIACILIVQFAALGLAVFLGVTAWEQGSRSRRARPPLASRADIVASKNLEVQKAAEISVMALQTVGLSALGGIWLARYGRPPLLGNAAVLATQVALGIAGGICAWCDSGFALFAGATIVILLLAVIYSDNSASRGSSRCAGAYA
jgi:hypothetical protein